MKDAMDALSSVVPGPIATDGVRARASGEGRRRDRPLGKEGAEVLALVPLFEGLSRRHRKKLADHADEVEFHEHETIVDTDQKGGTFFVILQGEAKVSRGGRTIARLGPGEFFGEISLLDGGPRTATVTAETPLVAVRIFKASFDKMLASEPGIAARVLAVVARRLREAERSFTG